MEHSLENDFGKRVVRILLVEDHCIIRLGMRVLLQGQLGNVICGEADDARGALDHLARERWDIVLLDITLPGRSGLDLLKDIVKLYPGLPVLMVSMHSEDPFATMAFQAGASGYISKTVHPDELVKAVKMVLNGERYVSAAYSSALTRMLNGAKDMSSLGKLTMREMEVLRLLAVGKRISDIARHLSLSVKTVSTHRGNMLRKLNLRTNGELIRYAIESDLA